MNKKRSMRISVFILIMLFTVLFGGCGKENKYARIGVGMSTDGMSTYLTYTANGFKKVSNYVFFAKDSNAALEKIRMDEQGIDVMYLPVKDLGLIKADDELTVILPDCFDENGELKGVWLAKDSWLRDAPSYSRKLIEGFCMSIDYRAGHMGTSYSEACKKMKDVRDFSWDVYKDSMEYCAAYSIANKEELADERFTVCDAEDMLEMTEGFAEGKGKLYELSRRAYDSFKMPGCKSFEEMFDYSLAEEALRTVITEE